MIIDIYNLIKERSHFRKVSTGALMAAEYISENDDSLKKVWSEYNSLAYVLTGEKTWITPEGKFKATNGDVLFCQKGGQVAFNIKEYTTKVLLIFFPDEFVKEVCIEYPNVKNAAKDHEDLPNFKVYPLNADPTLKMLFDSFNSYFFEQGFKSEDLLLLKFKELIVQILTSDTNTDLCAYFKILTDQKYNQIAEVMENNFHFNRKLEEYAKLANCSLSTFKREFSKIYNTTPGKWLLKKRLDLARSRLLNTAEDVNEIAYLSGFENTSHFIQAFKKEFGRTPSTFRKFQGDQ